MTLAGGLKLSQPASTAVCWYCLPSAGRVTKRRDSRTQLRCCGNDYLVTVIWDFQLPSLPSCRTVMATWLPAYNTQDLPAVDELTYRTSSQRGKRCRYRDWLLAGRSGVRIPEEARAFLVSKTSRIGSGSHPLPDVKRQGHEADHSPPPRAEVKYKWNRTFTFHLTLDLPRIKDKASQEWAFFLTIEFCGVKKIISSDNWVLHLLIMYGLTTHPHV